MIVYDTTRMTHCYVTIVYSDRVSEFSQYPIQKVARRLDPDSYATLSFST